MAARFVLPFADVGSGISPSDGATLEFFESGTSTQKDTFKVEALTTGQENANPVIANGDGVFPAIWLPDGARYKVRLRTKVIVAGIVGKQVFESDPVVGGVSASLSIKIFNTVAAMVASTELNIGDIVETVGYLVKGDGGNNKYEIVAAATGTVDGGSFIDLTGITGQAKGLFPGGIINVKQFAAVGDGTADDTTKFINALAFSKSKVHVLSGTAGFLIDSNLNIPNFKSLEGDYTFVDPRDGIDFNTGYFSRIILNSAAKITLNESSALRGLPIIRKGIIFPSNAAEVLLFAGTAVEIVALTVGQYVGHCAIVGFNVAVITSTTGNTEQLRCEYLNIDCNNGVFVDSAFDVAYIENVHCWPTSSVGLDPLTDADLRRPGTAFQFKNTGDWNRWTNCFSFAYLNGYVVDGCNSVTALECGADYTITSAGTNPVGFSIVGDSAETRLIGCQSAGQDVGYLINTTSTLGHVQMVGCNAWDADAHHVLNTQGDLWINGGRFRGGTANGVTPNNVGPTILEGVSFESIGGNAINSQLATHVVRHHFSTFTNITGSNVVLPFKPTVASVDPLVLNGEDQVFEVTGTTNFGTMNNAADYSGKTVSLKFTGILTVGDGGNLKLNGDFVTTADDVLTLISDGAAWFEVSRSAN